MIKVFKMPEPRVEDDGDEDDSRVPSEVPDGPELNRILGAATRPIPDPKSPEALLLAESLTRRLKRVENPFPGTLTTHQALALKESWEQSGGFFPLKVGAGKGLLSFLLPVVHQKRALYLCPAALLDDMDARFDVLRENWKGPTKKQLKTMSYELLSNKSSDAPTDAQGNATGLSRLEKLAPELIVLDEAHKNSNSRAACVLRLTAYLEANPNTIVVAMSGTFFKTSLKDAAHIMKWCLGEDAPAPTDFKEREAWAGVLDAKPADAERPRVAAYEKVMNSVGVQYINTNSCRQAFAQRMLKTPGVIGTQDQPLEIPLSIESWLPSEECDDIHAAFAALNETSQLPDGTELADGMSMARHQSTYGLGFYQVFSPPPPDAWRTARNMWAKACREVLKKKYNRNRGIISEGTLKGAIRKGLFPNATPFLEAWETAAKAEQVRTGLREPPTICVWISDEAIGEASAWADAHHGLIWVQHIGLGQQLSKQLGIPYYGGGCLDANGRHIMTHKGGPAVVSLAACGQGLNLQGLFHTNLWMCTPGEQSLARTHRQGQTRPVSNHIYLGCQGHLRSFERARDIKSDFAHHMTGDVQKIQYARTDMPTAYELSERGGVRWATKGDDDF